MHKITRINFVVALSPEAQPLIRYYKLKRDRQISAFEVYKNDDLQLIITGMGKYNAAIATGYMAGLSRSGATPAWINVGIAGGQVAEIGRALLINAITDSEYGKKYYPTICFESDLPQASLVTLNKPAENYEDGVLYDMEAAGFFAAASRFSPSELVHCCKIVSDNRTQGIEHITRETATAMIETAIIMIDKVAQALSELRGQLWSIENIEQSISLITQQYHFTTAQQNTLRNLLQNWYALKNADDPPVFPFQGVQSSGEYLVALENEINKYPVNY